MTALPMTYSPDRRSIAGRYVGIGLVFAAILVSLNFQHLLDEYALLTYKAPANILALEAPLGLTRQAQAIIDRAHPQIDTKAQFNVDCQTQTGELELGCYAHSRIYVLQIDSPQLQSEMQTVLAHELMHAVWARLSSADQTKLSRDLDLMYAGIHDSDLTARMADYAKTEPGEQENELHSILGTERTEQGNSELEAHYRLYFADRQTVVRAHTAYELVFEGQRQNLTNQLTTIKSLKAELANLDTRMEAYRSNGSNSAITSYNALVPTQNSLVDQINGLISTYDTGVDEYNALSSSIDSHQLTPESGV